MFSFKKIFKYLWPEMRKYKWLCFGAVLVFVLRVLAESIVRPVYFKKLIDILSVFGVDRLSLQSEAVGVVFVIIGLGVLGFATTQLSKFFIYHFQVNVVRNLRDFAFRKVTEHSYTFFTNNFTGSMVAKVKRFVDAFESMFDIFIYDFFQVFIILCGVFYVLVKESGLISLIFFVWVIVHVLLISFLIKRKIKYDLLEAEQDSNITGRLADVFGGISLVKFFSAHKNEVDIFHEYTEEGAKRARKSVFMGLKIYRIQGFLIFIVQSTVLYVMVNLWLKDEMSTGMVVLIQTYMVILFDKLWSLGNALVKFMKHASNMQEMIDIFEIIPDILDPKNPEKLKMRNGDIIFNNVHFKYELGEEVLSGFNLEVKHGEKIGLVGHSGAGKSTITKLLLRLNDVTEGVITIDGQDIRSVTQDDLRSVISYVPQEPILFHRTIRENISYSKPDATEEEIISVAKKAHAHEFISGLSNGYDTLVGERGVKLSGGERQRVAIARAMLKNAPILVLDEATSSLDSISESYIQDSLNELMKGKTTLVIAHRLSTIQKMDRIIVLDNGRIIEEGTHEELRKRGKTYASLWQHQTCGFLE